jgi:hypothetical protein
MQRELCSSREAEDSNLLNQICQLRLDHRLFIDHLKENYNYN